MKLASRVALGTLGSVAVMAALPVRFVGAFAAIALAARSTLLVGLTSAGIGLASGAFLAAIGLSLGGRGRLFVTRVAESLGALPTVLVVALLAAAPLGPPAVRIAVALGIARVAEAMHLVLLEARALSADGWVEASIALGARPRQLVLSHLAPRVLPLLGACALSGAAAVVPLELAVAYLGLAPATGLGGYAAAALAEGRASSLLIASLPAFAVAASLAWLASLARTPGEAR